MSQTQRDPVVRPRRRRRCERRLRRRRRRHLRCRRHTFFFPITIDGKIQVKFDIGNYPPDFV